MTKNACNRQLPKGGLPYVFDDPPPLACIRTHRPRGPYCFLALGKDLNSFPRTRRANAHRGCFRYCKLTREQVVGDADNSRTTLYEKDFAVQSGKQKARAYLTFSGRMDLNLALVRQITGCLAPEKTPSLNSEDNARTWGEVSPTTAHRAQALWSLAYIPPQTSSPFLITTLLRRSYYRVPSASCYTPMPSSSNL